MPLIKNNNAQVLVLCGTVRLMPGVNDVSDKDFTKIKKSKPKGADGPSWLELLRGTVNDRGLPTLQVIDEGAGSSKTGSKSLEDMTAVEAIALVKETFDRDLLNTWAEGESRKTVTDAIDAQLDAIKLTEDEKPKK